MKSEAFFELWVYLAATPLAGLTITLVAYCAGYALYVRCRLHPLANPVLIAVVLIVVCLQLGSVSYGTYFAGAQFVHFLLGPAVVGLAAPLALGIAEQIGGIAALAAVFAVATGIIGAALGKYVLDAVHVRDWRARG